MSQWLITILMTLFIYGAIFADTLSLKDGEVLTGKIVEDSGNELSIQTDFGLVSVPKNKIENISYDGHDKNGKNLQDQEKKFRKESKKKNLNSELDKPENWYLSFLFGVGSMRGADDLNGANKTIKDKVALYLNLSFLGTVNTHVLLGGGLSAIVISWSNSTYNYSTGKDDSYDQTLAIGLICLEMKVFFDEIASGFFLSLSPGISQINSKYTMNAGSQTYSGSVTSNMGYVLKGGLGFALNLNRLKSSFIFGADGYYSSAQFESNPYPSKTWTLYGIIGYAGWLW